MLDGCKRYRAYDKLWAEKICSQLEICPFDDPAAAKCGGPIRAKLEKQGAIICERDLQIAAIAMANRCVSSRTTQKNSAEKGSHNSNIDLNSRLEFV